MITLSDYLFDENREYLQNDVGEKEERSFFPYKDDWDYRIVTRTYSVKKYSAKDRSVISLLASFPLLSKEVMEDVLGVWAGDVVEGLYEKGALSRFSGTHEADGIYCVNTYFVTMNALNALRTPCMWDIEDMSVPMRLEVASLSKWCSYTMTVGKRDNLKIQYYGKPDKEHPYLEVMIRKKIKHSLFHSINCNFHVVCRPKSEDRMMPFLGVLLQYNSIMEEEEQKNGIENSFVVILCENDDNMEHFSVELNHLFRSRRIDLISAKHFLYSLVDDAVDEKGSFKFMHAISFSDSSLVRQQVAFR